MRKIWNFLSMATVGIAAWFAFTALGQLYAYKTMSAKTSIQVLDWNVEPLSSGYFTTEASFAFSPVKNSEGSSSAILSETIIAKARKGLFMNEFAAKKYIEEQQASNVMCYYSPKKPQICSLEKEFPLKATIHMGITLIVALYFLFVRKFIGKFEENLHS